MHAYICVCTLATPCDFDWPALLAHFLTAFAGNCSKLASWTHVLPTTCGSPRMKHRQRNMSRPKIALAFSTTARAKEYFSLPICRRWWKVMPVPAKLLVQGCRNNRDSIVIGSAERNNQAYDGINKRKYTDVLLGIWGVSRFPWWGTSKVFLRQRKIDPILPPTPGSICCRVATA